MKTHIIEKLSLEAYCTGTLPELEKRELEKHLKECSACRDYLRQLTQEKNAFLAKYPFESLSLPQKKKLVPFPLKSHIYALAASFILMLTGGWFYYSMQDQNVMRIKGGTNIRMVVKGLDGTIEERSIPTYYPNEQIQFIYSCGTTNKFMLFSIDEQGSLSTYLPAVGDSSVTIQNGAELPLPNSILLDDYIGNELFVAIFSERSLHVSVIKNHILEKYKNKGNIKDISLENTRDFTVHSFLLTKRQRVQ